jgi:hypothetical protein
MRQLSLSRTALFVTAAVGGMLMAGGAAVAQDAGGLRLAPGGGAGPVGLARALPFTPMPFVTARDIQAQAMPADRSAKHQQMIAGLRGDAGFLGGFSFGTPRAASRQPVQVAQDEGFFDEGTGFGFESGSGSHGGRRGARPIIINNQGPLAVTVGNGNLVQQQSATGPGPIAQQQVATTGGASGGGALNLVTGGGNIVQRAPK